MTQLEDIAASVGQLIETAQRQQQQAQAALERCTALAEHLEAIVQDEIRAAFVQEFEALGQACQRTGEALQALRRVASVRIALWAVGVVLCCAVIPLAVAQAVLPSRAELAQLRSQRDALATGVARLAAQGGRIDLRRCGAAGRLCARFDRSPPAFGASGDYLILKGY